MDPWPRIASETLMVGFAGPRLDRPTADRLAALRPAGVILFRRNLESPERTRDLLRSALPHLTTTPLLAIDQEGGRVSRLELFIGATPTAAALAEKGAGTVAAFAGATARSLGALGFNLDFAPVVDLCSPRQTNGIADRSFGVDPESVTRLAGAFLDGLQAEGVAGCLKHFPGLGETTVDSHECLPVVPHGLPTLEARDLIPFRKLGRRAASVMVGHGHYAGLDVEPDLPASASPRIIEGLLRDKIGFEGLVVSDDLEMGAVDKLDREGSYAVRSMRAGCDLLLYCSDLDRAERAARALAAEARTSRSFGRRLEEAAERVRRFGAAWPIPATNFTAWETARRELGSFVS